MIRVLHSVYGMNRGGLETFIMNVYRNIDRTKVQFDFLVRTQQKCDYDDEIFSLGGNIYYAPSRSQGLRKSIKKTDEFFQDHKEYKIVHFHLSSLSNVSTLRIAKKNGVPCRIVHSHNTRQGGSPIHKYLHLFNQMFIRSYATDFFACSELAAKWMYPKKIFEDHEFKIIYNGIEPEKFALNNDIRKRKREELGIVDEFIVGHIGRFHPQKNHVFLIDIFKEIHKKIENVKLLLVGDGDLRPLIEKKVEEFGLTNNVIFTGVRSDIPELLQVMDVFVFPSLYEGLGIVLVEAQASGLKCFTSDIVVPKEVNISGLVQFVSLNESAQFWAEEILKYKDYKRSRTTDVIINAGYDIRKIAEELQEWYESKI
ncbi:glycosyltransferase family 1 protein [Calidifontibacillus erzurumensis]|uniref:glycosyltransferase family 1 protein n=1 Tax=Calidifontibacillus erzurumensis TaxID=2741433 RepID=UPI0035B512E3